MSAIGMQRVAIYTRKSSEEGLEQEFNSLHAQREACEAFITSQKELGWKLLRERYDDGGLSGGSMERPALQHLLAEVRAGRVDVIIVYKIDRLTRSLTDFSKIVEILDANNVSFVSVTQQFNTSTSMGRLTLNMLLSFAQFEREVTAERIRDKFAASKRKGMWMGGVVPLGYDVKDRKLVINEREADTVRWLFQTYLEAGSVPALKTKADQAGIRSKKRAYKSGRNLGGTPITRGHLYTILSNAIYLGKIRHRQELHDGQHQAIVPEDMFNRVQAKLRENSVSRKTSQNFRQQHLLTGLVFDETGDRLSPSHSTNHGKRYRYYVSHRLIQEKRKGGTDGWRLPADQLEAIIVNRIIRLLENRAELVRIIEVEPGSTAIATIEAINKWSGDIIKRLKMSTPAEKRKHLQVLIDRINLEPEKLRIAIDRNALIKQFLLEIENGFPIENRLGAKHHRITKPVPMTEKLADGSNTEVLADEPNPAPDPIVLELPIRLQRRGIESRLMLAPETGLSSTTDPTLINLLADAHHFLDQLTSGACTNLADLAIKTGTSPTDISRILPLAFLAPDITRKILEGRQPPELTAQVLKRTKPLPKTWQEQRQ